MKSYRMIRSIVIILAIFALTSCSMVSNITGLFGDATFDLPISYDLSTISRTLETDYGITVSTVTATVENDFFSYGPVSLSFDSTTDIASGTIENIVEGTYTVTLQAYMVDETNDPVMVAEGSVKGIVISDGETTNANISMHIVVGLGDLAICGTITEFPSEGLVCYYNLDETSGPTVIDQFDDSDGENHGATINESGIVETAYTFNGIDEYVALPAISNGDKSFSFWLKTNAQDNTRLFGTDEGYYLDTWSFYICEDGELGLAGREIESGDSFSLTSQTVVADGHWHHVAATLSSTNNSAQIYIDGLIEDDIILTSELTMLDHTIYIMWDNFNDWFTSGSIDEIGIWDRPLDASEVTDLYNNGFGLSYL